MIFVKVCEKSTDAKDMTFWELGLAIGNCACRAAPRLTNAARQINQPMTAAMTAGLP
jgi:hypothetical protein